MNKNFKFIIAVLSFVLCFSAFAFGQKTTGNIEGTVTDPNGAVVPNATVTAKSTGTTAGFNQTMTSDSNGHYQFNQVPVGTYEVTATGSGFQTIRQQVSVVVDRTATTNFQLSVGQAGVTIDVTTDAATTLDISDTKIDTNITKRVIEELPSGPGFSSLLKLAPNVRPEPLAAGFQIDGASGAENVFNIDGQEVTNFRTGQLNTANNLDFNLVQEVQIKSTGYEAEYGGATGGIIQVVTPGGNDNWRGNFGISFQPAKLQGSPRVSLNRFSSLAQGGGGTEYFQPFKDGGTNYFPHGSISGPVIKSKLWFSATYAPQVYETNRRIDYYGNPNGNPADPSGRFTRETINYRAKQVNEQALFRLDAQPFSRLRLFATYLWNPVEVEGALPGLTEGLGGAPQEADFGGSIGYRRGSDFLGNQGGRQNSNNINGQATWNPTNWLIFNVRAGRTFLNEKLGSYGIPRATRFLCSASGTTPPAGAGCARGYTNFASNFQIDYDVSTRKTLDADASLVGINALGRHNFKFGYQLNKLFNTTRQGYRDTGVVVLYYGLPINSTCCSLTPTPGAIGSGYIQRFGTEGEASSDNNSLFAQDTWTINNRLTLNLGVRMESETVPNFGDAANTQAIKFGWGDKVSPRLGVAFDVFGNGKSKVFASYGWFYDRFKYELPRGSFGGDFYRRDFFEILPTSLGRSEAFNYYTLSRILGGRADELGGTCPIVGGPGFSRCQFDYRIATNQTGADIFESGAVDPNIKAARQSEYTFGYEQQLGNNFLFAGRFTHKHLDRTIEDIGVFNDQGSEAYIIGNPGLGLACEVATSGGYPCAKAQRDYDALEVRLDKRATNYFFNASYTWSRLFGNYSGLASSDEAGRSSPNVNRFFDLPPLGFNANGEPDNGRLATDRPHVFKAYGGYSFGWNPVNRTTVSGFTQWQSGTPLTTIYNLYSLGTTILYKRGDLGRTEAYTQTDFSIQHRYKFGRDNRFTLEGYLDILNLFDEKNVLTVQTTANTLSFTGGTALDANGNPTSPLRLGGCTACTGELTTFYQLFHGGIQSAIVNYLNNNNVGTINPVNGGHVQTPVANRFRNDYGMANGFQAPRDVRFGFRLFF